MQVNAINPVSIGVVMLIVKFYGQYKYGFSAVIRNISKLRHDFNIKPMSSLHILRGLNMERYLIFNKMPSKSQHVTKQYGQS